MERNNIFDFATSELSQDAFICWCLNWLNYKSSELRALAVDLLKEFGEEDVSDNQEILIKRQFKKIDILVVLKGLNRVYIIEDKVHSSESKDQIGGYKGKIEYKLDKDEKENLGIDENREVRTVYFKTGFHFICPHLFPNRFIHNPAHPLLITHAFVHCCRFGGLALGLPLFGCQPCRCLIRLSHQLPMGGRLRGTAAGHGGIGHCHDGGNQPVPSFAAGNVF